MTQKRQVKYSYGRILEISEDMKQITTIDNRFYRRNGEYYPSITSVLQMYPKGQHYEKWLKTVGFASEYIVKKAQEDGTATHELIEKWLNGEKLYFLNSQGNPQYNTEVWQMVLRFIEFWELYKPKLIETEVHLFSDDLKVAGTCDLICEIDNELWVIDFKTGNNLHLTNELQIDVYSKCYTECYGRPIHRRGLLWLKSSTRKLSKSRMQGKGWNMIEPERKFEENIEIFKTVKKLWDLENPTPKPSFETFQTIVKREL